MRMPDINTRVQGILDSVVNSADARGAAEIDYCNSRSPMHREKMKEAQEAHTKAYDQAVKAITNLIWTGGQFIEDLARGKA